MKKIIFFFMLLITSATSFSQPTTETPTVKVDYLQKSKNQKTTAWVLLGGGAGFILVGTLIGNGKEASFDDVGTGVVLGGIGALSMLGSIPLFIASGKNKRKAGSISFKNEMIPRLQSGSFVNHSVPSVNLKISL